MKQTDAIIFDMDGVLVSNDSFIATIKKTTQRLLWMERKLRVKVNDDVIYALKKIPGFNNDWDTSYALVDLLGRGITPEAFAGAITPLSPKIRQTKRYRNIRALFQSLYFGTNGNGYIAREKLLITKKVLTSLKRRFALGIATGRPKTEACFTAINLGLSPTYIPVRFIIGREDTFREKPFPDPLLLAARRMKVKNPVYVGDTINDVISAERAGMKVIYIGNEPIGDRQVTTVNNLEEVL